MLLGQALSRQAKYTEAVDAFRQALRLTPNDAKVHASLGVALVRLDKHAEAVAAFRKAIDLEPARREIHYNLGNTLDRMRKFDEAISEFRIAIQLKPDHASAHHGMGTALLDQRKTAEAVAEFRKALELDSKNASTHSNLGTALRRLGRFAEAAGEYRTAIRLRPKLGEAHCGLALALLVDPSASPPDRRCARPRPQGRRAHELMEYVLWTGPGRASCRTRGFSIAAIEHSTALGGGEDAYVLVVQALTLGQESVGRTGASLLGQSGRLGPGKRTRKRRVTCAPG